ncbi:MAG: hypothetical protein R2703_02215 [Micropruina glycogenica]
MDAIAELNRLIGARVRPTLGQAGHRHGCDLYERLMNQAIQVVNLQRHATPHGQHGKQRALNGGCYFFGLSTLLGEQVTIRKPTEPGNVTCA